MRVLRKSYFLRKIEMHEKSQSRIFSILNYEGGGKMNGIRLFFWNTNGKLKLTPSKTIRTIFFVNANCFIDAKHTLIILTN